MLLAVDIGNTNILFALYHNESFNQVWRVQTRKDQTEDEYAASLRQLFASNNLDFKDVSAIIISSVVPIATQNIKRLCEKYFQLNPFIIDPTETDFGLDIKLDKPHEVGADRIVNSVAAAKEVEPPFIVIDFGTATTFDVVTKEGYVGGAIAPGINLSIKALKDAAAKLPDIELERPSSALGNDTVSAMQSGVFWGYTGLINTILSKLKEELDQNVSIVATGGLARFFENDITGLTLVDENLTLKGLVEIYKRSKSNE